jgi:cysteine synthase
MRATIMKSHDLRSSIGFTPVVELRKLNPNPAVRLLAKLEGNSPGGSVKDRPALFMIAGAQKRGVVPPVYREENLDEKLTVDEELPFETTRRLAVEEGLFVGMSSGAAVAGAIRLARRISSGTIVTLLPDRGDRYLSTSLFRSMCGVCPP